MAKDKVIAVVLLSGGLDSATTAAMAQTRGFAVHGLTIEYGQRHAQEIAASRQVAAGLNLCRHVFSSVDLRTIGGSALTDDLDVPKSSDAAKVGKGIPVTYVPARNTIFLSLALAYAEVVGSRDIFIGVNAVDFSGYPDCRPAFIETFQKLARLATKMGVEGHAITIHAPLIEMSKSQIIRRGVGLGVDFSWTHSCYDPTEAGLACGRCDSCRLRKRGFAQAGMDDPATYVI